MKKLLLLLVCFLLIPSAAEPAQETSHMGTIIEESMYVPLRGVFESFGYHVDWDSGAAIIANNNQKVSLTVGSNTASVNGQPVTVGSPPVLIDGRICIPLRFVGESMDATVSWDSNSRTAIVKQNNRIVHVIARSTEPIKSYNRTLNINGRNISARIVEIPLHSATPDMVVANDTVGTTEELASMAKRNNAIVAINGTYFSAYEGTPMPYGNIIKNGQVLHRGSIGTTLGFRANGTAQFGHIEFHTTGNVLNNYSGWEDIVTGLGVGPRLLTDGRITVDPEGEGFWEGKITEISAGRSAVGVKLDGTVILLTTTANMYDLAHVMKQLGAYNAMNLDGGASSSLWYKGSYITPPGRLLSNTLIFK